MQVRAVNSAGGGTWSGSASGAPTPGLEGTPNADPVFTEGNRTTRSVPEDA